MATTCETVPSIAVPFLDLKQQYRNLAPELDQAIQRVLDTAYYIQGPQVAEFERAFAEYCGVKDAIALDSGTAALHLALLALGVQPGDEVIVPTNTFIATAAAVHVAGATPVFIEADPENWQMDVHSLEDAITPRCRAVIGVHLYGQPFLLSPALEICSGKGIPLIEDAAQAHGARFGNRRAGSIGRVGCFSFYPGKNLGAFGDGGAITTDDPELSQRLRRLRDHGRLSKYEHQEVGFNYRMDSIQGAVLNHKLRYLDEWNQRRRSWAARYRQQLSNLPLRLPAPIPDTEPVQHLFVVRSDQRTALAKFLESRNIQTGIHYPIPLHLQPAFRHLGYKQGDFPVAEAIADEVLSLPIFPEMTEPQFEHVCKSIADFFDRRRS
jgi:dTDP-4-amino-4,6-dideoxygalactose transaminase